MTEEMHCWDLGGRRLGACSNPTYLREPDLPALVSLPPRLPRRLLWRVLKPLL